jgi:hypothetical protein
MMQIRNAILWIVGVASAVLFADAALSFYKVLEFRAAFPTVGVLSGVLVMYGAVLSVSASIVYATLGNLRMQSSRALAISALICVAGLALNLFPLPEMMREAVEGKNASLGISLLLALVLQLLAMRKPQE